MAISLHAENMSFDYFRNLRNYHPAWKLLAATRAPMILSFLYAAFVVDNSREIAEYKLVSKLNTYLEGLEEFSQETIEAKELLTEWADDNHGWLRKFYPLGSDEVHYDLTAATQKAIEWVEGLRTQNFIGTESRLLMVFRLFHEIIEQSDENPERRVKELERHRAELDEEIAKAKQGHVKVLGPVQIKERYLQAMQLSREILADFRAVEQNFRDLGRTMQEKISRWDKGKGALLRDFFHNQAGIEQSEQGRSFQAFFDFLMSTAAQDDFEGTIRGVDALDAVKELPGSQNSHRIIQDWVNGSKHAQATLAVISEQLRRYVDENYLQEERRINRIVKNISSAAVSLRNESPDILMEMDALAPAITLPFDRPLFMPPNPTHMREPVLNYGNGQAADDSALYTHISVDRATLTAQIDRLLLEKEAISLKEVLSAYPIKRGLAEVIGYLSLAQDSIHAAIQTEIQEPVFWQDTAGNTHKADLCRIVYRRGAKEHDENG